MLQPFRLEEPESVAEASALLARYGDSARLYAGGTELLLVMKEGLLQYERLINIKLIPELTQMSMRDGVLHIGAATTHRTLEQSPLVRAHFPTLAAVEANVANVRVREVGTLGGNLCFAEPHADPGTLLQVYDATVQLDRDGGSRQLPVEDFFVDSFEVGLEADELLTSIQVPALAPHTAVVYRKFGFLERPSVGVAVAVTATAEQVHRVKLAVGCVGPVPRRMREVEEVLSGKDIDAARAAMDNAMQMAGQAADAVTDLHGSAEYKAYLVGVLLRQAFAEAYQTATTAQGG
jgi:aerobic carbon-monoxide dehydrogenase medium subunit